MDNKGQPPQYSTPPPGPPGQPVYPDPASTPQYAAQAQPHPYPAAPTPGPAPPDAVYQTPDNAGSQYRSPQPMQVGAAGENPAWQSNLMDCTPCGTCCMGTWLPCVLLGQTSDRMRDPTMTTASAFNSDCMIMCAIQYLTGCGWIYVMVKRSEIRERFSIKGDGTGDCCAAYWCPCCALIQQEKEVVARTQVQPNVQGYQAPAGMEVPAPIPQSK